MANGPFNQKIDFYYNHRCSSKTCFGRYSMNMRRYRVSLTDGTSQRLHYLTAIDLEFARTKARFWVQGTKWKVVTLSAF
jgi:hypothetical protein